jgi:SAM-dependent methyltransferase
MGTYERYVLPRLINCVCGSPLVDHQRRLVVPCARGRVLEIGFGSGLNLPHYDRSRVELVWGLEPSPQMRALAAARVAASGLDVRFLDMPGEHLPLPDRSVDTVVVTFTLCTIPDVMAALGQIRRVLRPDGELLFCEHGAAPDARVRRWQDRLDGVWGRLAGGCHLNRDIAALIRAAGFRLDAVHSAYLPGTPRFAGYNTWGTARVDPAPS